ncbi:hypothetical protein Dda_7160 [Drechslerella dactyloides]|uniref:Uncharacterized protein n=1 Tax=Drechslerella dactyloides TaxID=74499 RepID=A0AAD6IWY7_DREDA|nr:hypothetical protein Dda_7160 [Drechslerella dactyloides]
MPSDQGVKWKETPSPLPGLLHLQARVVRNDEFKMQSSCQQAVLQLYSCKSVQETALLHAASMLATGWLVGLRLDQLTPAYAIIIAIDNTHIDTHADINITIDIDTDIIVAVVVTITTMAKPAATVAAATSAQEGKKVMVSAGWLSRYQRQQ